MPALRQEDPGRSHLLAEPNPWEPRPRPATTGLTQVYRWAWRRTVGTHGEEGSVVAFELFVNGGLMHGLRAHANLDGAEFLETTRTAPRYRLYSIDDRHPGMFEVAEGGVSVAGELYRVPADVWERVEAGEPLVWSISVSWHDDWQIFAQVTYSVGDDIETVRESPDRRATTPEEFVQRLRETVSELVSTAGEVDLAGYARRARGE